MANSPRPDWRKGKTATSPRTAAGSTPAWRQKQSHDANKAIFIRRLQLGGLALLIVGMVVYFAIWAFRQVKSLPLIAVVVTKYQSPIPPNSFALEDFARLRTTNTANMSVKHSLQQEVTKDELIELLKERVASEQGGPNKDVVVIYLSTHGVSDEQGRPCLLTSDSRPLDANTWLPVETLLTELAAAGSSRKLVILDCGRIESEWSLGQLYNSFPERLQETLKKLALPNLHVMASCGAGQVSLAAPELGNSAFGYYVALGLQGQANKRAPQNQVSLGELFEFVSGSLARWSVERRATLQTPILYPDVTSQNDFALVYSGSESATSGSNPEPITNPADDVKSKLDSVVAAWKRLAEVQSDRRLVHFDPIGLAQTRSHLLMLEELALSGGAYAGQFQELIKDVTNYVANAESIDRAADLISFRLSPELGMPRSTADESTYNILLSAWRAADGTPPPPKEGEPPLPTPSYPIAANVAWNWLIEQDAPTNAKLQQALQWIDSFRSPVRPNQAEPVEILLVRMLSQFLDLGPENRESSSSLFASVKGAMTTRHVAEQTAMPSDERVHYGMQPIVERADSRRRLAEDRLFIGGAELVKTAQSEFQAISAATGADTYAAARRRGNDIQKFLELRDRAFLELPHLAHWAIQHGKIRSDERIALTDLVTCIQAVHELADQIDANLTVDDPSAMEALNGIYNKAATALDSIRTTYYSDAQRQVDDSGVDSKRLRDIRLSMRTPLLNAEQRQALWERYHRLLFVPGHEVSTGPGPSSSESNDSFLNWLGSVARHPAAEILDRSRLSILLGERKPKFDPSAASILARLEKQGAELRWLLGDTLNASNELERDTNTKLENSTETPGRTRAGLSEADRLTRAAAPMMGNRLWNSPLEDPAHRLLMVDLYYYTLWQCKRVVDDCWGPLPGQEQSYFAAVAPQLLNAAARLCQKPVTLRYQSGGETVDLKALTEARATAVRSFRIQQSPITLTGEEDSAPLQAMVSVPGGLPKGGAAVFVHPADNRRNLISLLNDKQEVVRRSAIAIGDKAPTSLRFANKLPLAVLRSQGAVPDLSTAVLFRGHLKSEPFQLRVPKESILADVRPSKRNDASVLVSGDTKRRVSIMFIFDCSGSMRENGRIKYAQEALSSLLADQLKVGSFSVGLRAYAHRARWDPKAPQNIIPSDLANGQTVNPDFDVERLVPIAPLTLRHSATMNDKLNQLGPFGQTPLYFSLKQTIESDIFPDSGPKRIILITDGLNDQFKKENQTTDRDVQEALRANPLNGDVQIDVVLIDAGQVVNDSKNRDELQKLRNLCASTKGQFYPANNADDLRKNLRNLVRPPDFAVSLTDERPSQRQPLGSWGKIDKIYERGNNFKIQLFDVNQPPSIDVVMEGGEALRLEYARVENELLFKRYEPNEVDPADDTRDRKMATDRVTSEVYEVQALLPKKTTDRVATFFVSVQNADPKKFTTRPKQVWVEIEPQNAAREAISSKRQIFDIDFVMDRPVPVFRFTVSDWPDAASHASLRFWCKMTTAPPKVVHVQDVSVTRAAEFSVPGLADVAFSSRTEPLGANGEGLRVIVDEKHKTDDDLYRARVQAVPAPDRIEHRYQIGIGYIRHVFDFERSVPVSIHVTTKDNVIKDAIEVPTLSVKVKE